MRRAALAAGLLACLLGLSGCGAINLNADGLLRAPKQTGDRDGVQQALAQYLAEQMDTDEPDYTLKYPKEGNQLTSFLFLDGEEEAAKAVAFYGCPKRSANVRILYLEKENGVWRGVSDLEGYSEDIGQVFLSDLDADGQGELLVGWNLPNTRDLRLMAYDVLSGETGDYLAAVYDTSYTALVTADMTAVPGEELLLLNIVSTESNVSARLLAYGDGAFREQGNVRLDGGITRFTKWQAVRWSKENGVFLDGAKGNGVTVTELVLWDGEKLTAPLYNAQENITTLTARESGLPFADVDNDGVPEWPISQRLPGYEEATADAALYQTTYYRWEPEGGSARQVLTAVVNAADGYMAVLGNDLRGQVTAVYRKPERLLELQTAADGTPLLRVCTCSRAEKLPEGYQLLRQGETLQVAFCVPETGAAVLTDEQARYMITFLS